MENRKLMIVVLALAVLVTLGAVASRCSFSALEEPSVVETKLATMAKRWFVGYDSRSATLPVLTNGGSEARTSV